MDDDDLKYWRPYLKFAGFLVPISALIATALAYRYDALTGAGWNGGEYAWTFVGVAVLSVVVGLAFKALPQRSPWHTAGSGLLLAAGLGFAVIVGIFVLFMIAMSQWRQ